MKSNGGKKKDGKIADKVRCFHTLKSLHCSSEWMVWSCPFESIEGVRESIARGNEFQKIIRRVSCQHRDLPPPPGASVLLFR